MHCGVYLPMPTFFLKGLVGKYQGAGFWQIHFLPQNGVVQCVCADPTSENSVLVLFRVAALGLAAGVLLVLLLFCLYRVLCPRNYGQNGAAHGRRRRGDLPCDDYGYSPPVSEISPLLLRGHSMVRGDARHSIKKKCKEAPFFPFVCSHVVFFCPAGHRMSGQ